MAKRTKAKLEDYPAATVVRLPEPPAAVLPAKKKGRPKGSTKVKVLAPVAPEQKKEIEIRAAHLRSGMFCTYSFDHNLPGSVTSGVTWKNALPVHDDLRNAFKKLYVHLAVICEEIQPDEIDGITDIQEYDPEHHKEGSLEHRISFFNVHSWRLDGEYEKEGVILSGEKRLSTGEYLKLETPKKSWHSKYVFIDELHLAIHDCIVEVEEYHKGKRAPDRQQELGFPDLDDKYVEEDI
jgi:hypothetical protein